MWVLYIFSRIFTQIRAAIVCCVSELTLAVSELTLAVSELTLAMYEHSAQGHLPPFAVQSDIIRLSLSHETLSSCSSHVGLITILQPVHLGRVGLRVYFVVYTEQCLSEVLVLEVGYKRRGEKRL